VVEKPARVARHRPAPLREVRALQPDSDPYDDEDDVVAPRRAAAPIRLRAAGASGEESGLRVTSVETRVLSDGRVVTVNVAPRGDVVRSLVAQHTQSFASPRSRRPFWDW